MNASWRKIKITDSAWYVDMPGGTTIETGDILGELTDELDGAHIMEWVGSDPKSYSYLTNKGKMVTIGV